MENVQNRSKIEFIKKGEEERLVMWQSRLTFNGTHKSYAKYDSFTIKQNDVLMNKPIYLGFSVLELSKLLMYENYYDNFQPFFGEENLQLHYTDCDSMVSSVKTQDIINDLHNLRDLFDFSNLNR